MIAVGDLIETWFSGNSTGYSRVVAIEPYRGRYTQDFTHVLTVTAPRTQSGVLEMAYLDERASVCR